MTPGRNRPTAATKREDPNAAIIAELRTTNRLLAAFTTRDLEPQKAIVFLDAAGFGYAQIAGLLGINPVTVRTTLFRARKAAEKSSAKTKAQDASSDDVVGSDEDADAGDPNGNA